MNAIRRICVVTGSRAEYGLLYWLLKEIAADVELELQLIATGMHLSHEFGLTWREIEADGFRIDARVDMLLSGDSNVAVTKSIGLGVIGFADALDRLAPDVVVLLGDRFEILAAAQAAMICRIPVAHLHGGETSEGAFDEGVRHAITKMAQLHFVAAEPYRKRVIQLGEHPSRVFDVGALGLEGIARMSWIGRPELESSLAIELRPDLLLVTYHPATLGEDSPESAMEELLAALREFPASTIVFTYPNADTGGRALIRLIDGFVAEDGDRRRAFASLGQRRYLSLMRLADVVVGNSSSALIEAPALRKAAVNLGDRQKGRLKASSVIDAREDRGEIAAAIRRALSDPFRAQLADTVSLYGDGDASRRIVKCLKDSRIRLQKPFFDIDHGF